LWPEELSAAIASMARRTRFWGVRRAITTAPPPPLLQETPLLLTGIG
jgi:hypothetical protein